MTAYRFGPLVYELIGAAPSFLSPYQVAAPPGRVIALSREPIAHAIPLRDTAILTGADSHTIYLPAGADPERALHAPLAALVARDLAEHSALLLHASAVRVEGGVALIVGPPSAGKTTFARHEPTRAFAGNAVCASREGDRWIACALPFASDPDPALDARDSAEIAAIVELVRGASAAFEWIPPSRATMVLMSCVSAPAFDDPWRRQRASAALDLAASVALASLAASGSGDDLNLLDRSLSMSPRP